MDKCTGEDLVTAAKQKIECVNRFIDLANEMKNEGKSLELISSGFMTACSLHSTYVVTGNDGALMDSGVEKMAALFKEELANVQQAKIEQARREGRDVPAATS